MASDSPNDSPLIAGHQGPASVTDSCSRWGRDSWTRRDRLTDSWSWRGKDSWTSGTGLRIVGYGGVKIAGLQGPALRIVALQGPA